MTAPSTFAAAALAQAPGSELPRELLIAGILLVVLVVIARICLPRRRPDPAAANAQSERARHFVRLVDTPDAAEAERLAGWLRDRGIVALANAEPLHERTAALGTTQGGGYQAFVAVVSVDVERAQDLLDGEDRAEGDASVAEIERELAEDAPLDEREVDDDGEDDYSSRSNSR